MFLTDDEQCKLLDELSNTSQRIEQSVIRALKKTGLPDDVVRLRDMVAKRREDEKGSKRGGVKVWIWAKSVLSFASKEADKIRLDE